MSLPLRFVFVLLVATLFAAPARAEEWERRPLPGDLFSFAVPVRSEARVESGTLAFQTPAGLWGYGHVQPRGKVLEVLREWNEERYGDVRTGSQLADGVGRMFLSRFVESGIAIEGVTHSGGGGVDLALAVLSALGKAKDGTPMRIDVATNAVGDSIVALVLVRGKPTGLWSEDAEVSRILRSLARGKAGAVAPLAFDASRAIVAVRKNARPPETRTSLEPGQLVLIDPLSGIERTTRAVRGASTFGARYPAWSPDRKRVLFSGDRDHDTALYRENLFVHDLDTGTTRRVTDWTRGGEGEGVVTGRVRVVETGKGARTVPDGSFRVVVAGRSEEVALDAEGRFRAEGVPSGRRWVRVHGTIEAAEHAGVSWVDVPPGGAVDTGEIEVRWRKLSAGTSGDLVGVIGLDNFARVRLTEPAWAPDGSILFVEKHHVISNGTSMKLITRTRSWDASRDGKGAAWQPDETSSTNFEATSDTLGWTFARLGRVSAGGDGFRFVAGRLAPVASPRFSPRGDRAAFRLDGGTFGWEGSVAVHGPSRLVVTNANGGEARVLPVPLDPFAGFGFGPDGSWVIAITQLKAEYGVERRIERITLADGSRRVLARVPDALVPGRVDVSPDGNWVVVEYGSYPTGFEGWADGFEPPVADLWLLRLDAENAYPVPLTTGGRTFQPSWK